MHTRNVKVKVIQTDTEYTNDSNFSSNLLPRDARNVTTPTNTCGQLAWI